MKEEFVGQHRFLSARECRECEAVVLGLRNQWKRASWLGLEYKTQRKNLEAYSRAPFFVLGSPSTHARNNRERRRHRDRVPQMNRLLHGELPWLYKKLGAKLESLLGRPVEFHARQSLPGFHILESHPVFLERIRRFHCDLQVNNILWKFAHLGKLDSNLTLQRTGNKYDFYQGKTLSLTVPVALPPSGATLFYKRSGPAVLDDVNEEAVLRKIERLPTYVHRYRLGELTLHTGMQPHQLGPWKKTDEGARRITLQGHGILIKDRWFIYW